MNVFVIKGIAKDVPLETIFRGVTPFIIAQIVLITMLVAFPSIALWLFLPLWRVDRINVRAHRTRRTGSGGVRGAGSSTGNDVRSWLNDAGGIRGPSRFPLSIS